MGRKLIDDFIKEPIDKMSQTISDMTYNYEQTIVPKEHYKKLLQKEIMELASNEPSIELNLLKPYYDMISSMLKENPKFFYKALLLADSKTTFSKINAITLEALEQAWQEFNYTKEKYYMKEMTVKQFTSYCKSGSGSTFK